MNSIVCILSILSLFLLGHVSSSFLYVTENSSCRDGCLNSYTFSPHNEDWKKCRRSRICLHTEQSSDPPPKFYIRKARYMELGHAVNIIIDGFYSPSAFLRPYLYLSELSRLQGNFPYDDEVHTFLVACTMEDKEEKIIGFVDVDQREGKKVSDAPRPYLSDLTVHSQYRRIGVAKALVRSCEKESMKWGKEHLYLRVDKSNDAALSMYKGLNYVKEEHPYFGVGKDTTTLLKHMFGNEEINEEREEATDSSENISYVI